MFVGLEHPVVSGFKFTFGVFATCRSRRHKARSAPAIRTLHHPTLPDGTRAFPKFASTITVLPSTQDVNTFSQAIVSLNIAGLGNGVAPSVGTVDMDVAFDPTILALNAVTSGNQLDILGLGDLQFTIPGVGTVNLFELSFDSASDLSSLQAPAFVLATLTSVQ